MAKPSPIKQLDQAVEALLAHRESALPPSRSKLDPKLAALLQIAADLRGLPSDKFKARLRADLQRRASMATTGVKPIREGFHTLTPYLIVSEAAQLIEFMRQTFGAVELFRAKRPDGLIMHAEVRIDDSMVELADATAQYPPAPAAIHLYVTDADAVYHRALRAGAASVHEPVDQPYDDREAGVKDAFGNHWYIATHKGTSHVPEGLRAVTPYLHPRGAARMIDFLKRAFGAEEVARAESPDGTIVHAKVRIGDSILEMGEAHGPYQPMPCALHLYVKDTDALYVRALRAGASSIEEPVDKPYGDRSAGVADPFGNQWFIATHIKDISI
jgi:PhnB protein